MALTILFFLFLALLFNKEIGLFKVQCVCVRMCVHAQSCLTLCDSMDCSPSGSSVHVILARGTILSLSVSHIVGTQLFS